MTELLLGAGRARDKRILTPANPQMGWQALKTHDILRGCGCDYTWDLEQTPWRCWHDDSFDEVHAYEVLEHLGRQGDFRAFFAHFYELWRILKPDGYLVATCPSRFSEWLWGDPGHTRAILPATLHFLARPVYQQCEGPHPTSMSDYRHAWKGDFEIRRSEDDRTTHRFVLQAVKPARQAAAEVK